MRFLRKGFGLLEVTIALAVLGVAMVAFTQLMSGTFKGQRRIEDKAKQTDFANRLQNIIYDQSSCTAALLSGDPIIFDPKDMAAFNNDPVKPKVTLVLGDGTRMKEGNGIETLSLRVRNEVPPSGSGKYEGNLWVSAPGVSQKSVMKPSDIGLMLLTVPEGTSGLRRVTQCFTRNEVDGKRSCDSLGGKWINSISRCLFGSELKLASNEWVDPAEFKPDGPLEGAFVTKCHYRRMNYITSYTCWNVSSNFISRCMFDGAANQGGMWVMKLPKATKPSIRCDNGVTINLPDSSFNWLSDNEVVDKLYVGRMPDGAIGSQIDPKDLTKEKLLENYEVLPNAQRCYTDPNGVVTMNCNQGANALEGKVGSCLFINGGFAYGNSIAEGGVTSLAQYTGWIWVTNARTLVATGSGPNRRMLVQEAAGRKCYMTQTAPTGTEKSVSGFVTDLKDPFDLSNTNVLLNERYKAVQECDFLGDNGGPQPSPAPGAGTTAASYRGRYLMRYACDQGMINPDNLTGEPTEPPSLTAKSCWYFKDVPVAPDFQGNSGITTNGMKRTYTGWMYLRANLPNVLYKTEAGTNVVYFSGAAGSTNAVPCNAGVRLTN